jgi:hypothetical protein
MWASAGMIIQLWWSVSLTRRYNSKLASSFHHAAFATKVVAEMVEQEIAVWCALASFLFIVSAFLADFFIHAESGRSNNKRTTLSVSIP